MNVNRDWVSTGIADRVGDLAHWVDSVDWRTVGTELEDWAKGAEHFVDEIGGAKTIAEALGGIIAYEGVKFAAGPMRDIVVFTASVGTLIAKISTELPAAWAAAGRAATAASEVEVAAIEATSTAVEAEASVIAATSASLASVAAPAAVIPSGKFGFLSSALSGVLGYGLGDYLGEKVFGPTKAQKESDPHPLHRVFDDVAAGAWIDDQLNYLTDGYAGMSSAQQRVNALRYKFAADAAVPLKQGLTEIGLLSFDGRQPSVSGYAGVTPFDVSLVPHLAPTSGGSTSLAPSDAS